MSTSSSAEPLLVGIKLNGIDGPLAAFEIVQRERKRRAVGAYLATLPSDELRSAVLKACEAELTDLGPIVVSGGGGGGGLHVGRSPATSFWSTADSV